MQQPDSKPVISRDRYDAVLLDLDGVITDTASIHAVCWKQMFDEYLQMRATQRGEAFRPFEIDTDYRLYVDGKPRFDGARDFLTSRNIQLPKGSPHNPPQAETVSGLANRKDALVNKIVADKGVQPYEGSVKFLRQMRNPGVRIAAVTSSAHSETVLRAAELEAFFDVGVDGTMVHAQHLAGKPAPDTFLMAARPLALQYAVSPQPFYCIGAPNSAKTPYNTTTSLISQPNTNGAPSAQSAIRAPFQTIAQASVEPDIQPQYVFLLTTGATGLPPGVLDTRVPGAGKLQSGRFVARARYHRRRLCRRHDAPLLPGNTTAGLQVWSTRPRTTRPAV